MNIFEVEVFKLIKSKKYIMFCLALVTLMSIQVYNLYNKAQNELPTLKFENNIKLLENFKAKVLEEDLNLSEKEKYENKIKAIEEENKDLKEEIAHPNQKWEDKLIKNNEILEKDKKQSEMALNFEKVEQDNASILINNYLLDNNIEPRKNYEIYSFIDIGEIISFNNIIFLPILIMILSHDLISGEIQFSTIKALLTKPIKRGSVILTKLIAVFIISTLTLIILELTTLLVLGIIFDMGSSMYPITVGTKYKLDAIGKYSPIKDSTYIITAQSYLIKEFIMQVLFIFVASSFGIFISTISNTNTLSLMISSITMFFLNIITYAIPQKFLSTIYPYLFTSYVDGSQVINGSINGILSTSIINIPVGIIVCLIWSIIFITVAYKRFVNSDVVA